VFGAFRAGYVFLASTGLRGVDANLCDTQDMNYQGSTCICRVPKAQLKGGTVVECVHCGACHSPSVYSTTNID
jgi:hypothetical protein